MMKLARQLPPGRVVLRNRQATLPAGCSSQQASRLPRHESRENSSQVIVMT